MTKDGNQNPFGAADAGMPVHYDRALGPVFFIDYADDIARRTAASAPAHVLELAAGTGIVTRRLREAEPVVAAVADAVRGQFGADAPRMPLQAIVFEATRR